MTSGSRIEGAQAQLRQRSLEVRNVFAYEERVVRGRGRGRWVFKGAAFLGFALVAVALLSFVVMSLWNELIPSLFSGRSVSFWQAAGLLVLTRILVGGFRGHGGPPWGGRHRQWRNYMRERWESMTPEERERLREKFKHGGCGWSPPDEGAESPKP
jgi:hypothetical protein